MALRVEPSRVVSWAASSEPWRLLLTYFFLCLPARPPANFTFTSLCTVHECSRMFSQQINTTFDTSLLCPQRNRINSRSHSRSSSGSGSSYSYTSCLYLPRVSSSSLPGPEPSLVMVSKVLAHSSFDRPPSPVVALALPCGPCPVPPSSSRLCWPVDTFA